MKSQKCTWLGDLGIASYSGLGSWKSPWITRGGNLDHDKERLIDDGNCCLQLVCVCHFRKIQLVLTKFLCQHVFQQSKQFVLYLMFFSRSLHETKWQSIYRNDLSCHILIETWECALHCCRDLARMLNWCCRCRKNVSKNPKTWRSLEPLRKPKS